MSKTIFQVPIDKDLRDQAVEMALASGFSSLQEPVRLFIRQFTTGDLKIKFESKIQLSPKAIRRYDRITEDFKTNKNIFTVHGVEELMKHLNHL